MLTDVDMSSDLWLLLSQYCLLFHAVYCFLACPLTQYISVYDFLSSFWESEKSEEEKKLTTSDADVSKEKKFSVGFIIRKEILYVRAKRFSISRIKASAICE